MLDGVSSGETAAQDNINQKRNAEVIDVLTIAASQVGDPVSSYNCPAFVNNASSALLTVGNESEITRCPPRPLKAATETPHLPFGVGLINHKNLPMLYSPPPPGTGDKYRILIMSGSFLALQSGVRLKGVVRGEELICVKPGSQFALAIAPNMHTITPARATA